MRSAPRLDGRVFEAKNKIRIVNISDQTLPAYGPLVLTYDNEQHVLPEGPFDGGFAFGGGPQTIVGNELIWPASFACMAETGYLNCLYAINGPFDLPPERYGTAYLDYPRAILFDPESFPIPVPGTREFTLGTWDDYQNAYPGDIEGPPPLGLKILPGINSAGEFTGQLWQPATFNADFPLWTVLWWDVDRSTGQPVGDRAIVVPYDARAGTLPVGGSVGVVFSQDCEEDVDNPVIGPGWPLVIQKPGLYQLQFYGTMGVQAAGVGAQITLQLTYGPQWDLIQLAGTPIASSYNGAPPVSGETVPLAASGLELPRLRLTDTGPYAAGETITLSYDSYGFGPIVLSANVYLLPGDTLGMIVQTLSNDPDTGGPVEVGVTGALNYNRLNNNPYGGLPIFW